MIPHLTNGPNHISRQSTNRVVALILTKLAKHLEPICHIINYNYFEFDWSNFFTPKALNWVGFSAWNHFEPLKNINFSDPQILWSALDLKKNQSSSNLKTEISINLFLNLANQILLIDFKSGNQICKKILNPIKQRLKSEIVTKSATYKSNTKLI